MAKIIGVVSIFAFFVATTFSLPSIDSGNANLKLQEQQAMIAMSEDGKPEFVILGDDVGRAGQLGSLFNFTAFLEGRPANQTAINFVPLITILASGFGG